MTPEQLQLYHEHLPAAGRAAAALSRRHRRLRVRHDDLQAAALVGLAHAVETYDGRGELGGWAYTCALREALDWLRAAEGTRRMDRAEAARTLSLDALRYARGREGRHPIEVAEPATETPLRHDAAEYLDDLTEGLDPLQRQLVRRLLGGEQQQEIAAGWDVSPSRVSQPWRDVRRHCLARRALLAGAAQT